MPNRAFFLARSIRNRASQEENTLLSIFLSEIETTHLSDFIFEIILLNIFFSEIIIVERWKIREI